MMELRSRKRGRAAESSDTPNSHDAGESDEDPVFSDTTDLAVGSEAGCEAALAALREHGTDPGAFWDPGRSGRLGGYWYITRQDHRIKKANGSNGSPVPACGERNWYNAAHVQRRIAGVQAGRAAGKKYDSSKEKHAAARTKRARANHIYGLSDKLIDTPSDRCSNCEVKELPDGTRIATGCTHHCSRATGQDQVTEDDIFAFRDTNALAYWSSTQLLCVGCYAKEHEELNKLRFMKEAIFMCELYDAVKEELQIDFLHLS